MRTVVGDRRDPAALLVVGPLAIPAAWREVRERSPIPGSREAQAAPTGSDRVVPSTRSTSGSDRSARVRTRGASACRGAAGRPGCGRHSRGRPGGRATRASARGRRADGSVSECLAGGRRALLSRNGGMNAATGERDGGRLHRRAGRVAVFRVVAALLSSSTTFESRTAWRPCCSARLRSPPAGGPIVALRALAGLRRRRPKSAAFPVREHRRFSVDSTRKWSHSEALRSATASTAPISCCRSIRAR